MIKLKTLYILIFGVAFMQLGNVAAAQHMVDSSEYESIVQKIQQRGNAGQGVVRINQSSAIDGMLRQNALANQQNQTL